MILNRAGLPVRGDSASLLVKAQAVTDGLQIARAAPLQNMTYRNFAEDIKRTLDEAMRAERVRIAVSKCFPSSRMRAAVELLMPPDDIYRVGQLLIDRAIQSANAVKSKTVSDSAEERHKQKKKHKT